MQHNKYFRKFKHAKGNHEIVVLRSRFTNFPVIIQSIEERLRGELDQQLLSQYHGRCSGFGWIFGNRRDSLADLVVAIVSKEPFLK